VQSLKVGAYEVITALGLMGVVYMYLALQLDPRIINPTLVLGGLIAVYAVTAISSEAVIVSGLRPAIRQVIATNMLVAVIVTQPAWGRVAALKGLAAVAIGTGVLRMLVAIISLRTSKVAVHRFTSALVGGSLFLATVWAGFNLAEQAYYDYYFFPKFKGGYIMPTRWQDFVTLVALWSGTFVVLYVSFRLLKYAFGARNTPIVAQ
jgi:hypothetical protein